MAACDHAYQTKGKYYNRRNGLLGGQLFTVFRYMECAHCKRTERKVVSRKRVTDEADTYERHLRFSGIKPERRLN